VVLSTTERVQLAAIAADRNGPRKRIERAHIVLASTDPHVAQRVAQSIGVSRPAVWRWQQRFAEMGLKVCDATRPGKTPIAAEATVLVVTLTCTEPPRQATPWTGWARDFSLR
jgi:transposase